MIILIILALVVMYSIITYNSLLRIKDNVAKAWANIDVLLKQRNDELPKLIDACKAFMAHESQTLEKVVEHVWVHMRRAKRKMWSVWVRQSLHDQKGLPPCT